MTLGSQVTTLLLVVVLGLGLEGGNAGTGIGIVVLVPSLSLVKLAYHCIRAIA